MRITLLAAVPLGLSLTLASLASPALAAVPPTRTALSPALAAAKGGGAAGPGGVRARSAYLVDETSKQPLWGRAAGTRRAIGSITKVMTAVVVLREGGLDRRVRVRPADIAYAAARHGSTARLRPGDRFTVRELLAAMLLPSGCDAASVLANAYGRGHARFVRKMNRTARRLGMRSTHYNDPAGLPPAPGWSTARDLVALGEYAMRFPDFRSIVARDTYVDPANRAHKRYVWHSTNTLLGDYPGLIGIKSGFTSEAGYSFLFAARRYGHTLVGAVLDSSKKRRTARFEDATRMLDWGFGWN